jgi:hypothetical protein
MDQRQSEPGGARGTAASGRRVAAPVAGVCEVCGRAREDLVLVVDVCLTGCCSDREVGICRWCREVINAG